MIVYVVLRFSFRDLELLLFRHQCYQVLDFDSYVVHCRMTNEMILLKIEQARGLQAIGLCEHASGDPPSVDASTRVSHREALLQ